MVNVRNFFVYFIYVFRKRDGWIEAWHGVAPSVIWSIGVHFATLVMWIRFIWSPAIYNELLDRLRSPRVQYKHLPSALEHWLGKTIIGRFSLYHISWSSCVAVYAFGDLRYFNGPAMPGPLRDRLLLPNKQLKWLTEVQSKCQPDTFAKKQWQDENFWCHGGQLYARCVFHHCFSEAKNCVQKSGFHSSVFQGVRALWIARRKARTCESKGECHKARRMIRWFVAVMKRQYAMMFPFFG